MVAAGKIVVGIDAISGGMMICVRRGRRRDEFVSKNSNLPHG
jgi:hypothetical protein